jgi:cyclopropane fatty-acyl-phospholipid synthase-like methyltransferase
LEEFKTAFDKLKSKNSYKTLEQDTINYFFNKSVQELSSGTRLNHVVQFVKENPELKKIAEEAMKFLDGFYSDFALELLSSIDYISQEAGTLEKDVIMQGLSTWSDRKRSLLSDPKYLSISLSHLNKSKSNFGRSLL